MKISTGTIGWGIAAFVWSIFMGVTAISIGVGAAFPQMNLIAKPFVCPNGQMTVDQQTSHPTVGSTLTRVTWYCADAEGHKTQLDILPMSVYAGAIYGFVLFVVVVIIWAWARRKSLASTSSNQASTRTHPGVIPTTRHNRPPMKQAEAEGEAVARMAELKKLRAENMISEAEYQQKRAEILKKL